VSDAEEPAPGQSPAPEDDFSDLRDDPRVKAFVASKLRGQGKRIADLEQQIATARAEPNMTALLEAEEATAAVQRFTENLISRIPADRQSLVPTDLPPSKLADWLSANMTLLVAPPRTVHVDGSPGRSMANPPDKVAQARARMKAKIFGRPR
jgi:hypothetical protein